MSLIQRIPAHLWVAGSAWASRIVTAAVQLLSIRILLSSLGTEKYAVFVLLTGLIGWYTLIDIGIGTSLQNAISGRRARNLRYADYVQAALLSSMVLLVFGIALLYLTSPYLGPWFLSQFPLLTNNEKNWYFFSVGVIFLSATVGGIVYKIWYAEHRGYLSNILPAAAGLIGLVGILVAGQSQEEDRLYMSLVVFNAPTAILALIVLGRKSWLVRKERRRVAIPVVKALVNRGIKFWLFTLMASVLLQADYLILSQYASSADIVRYNLVTRIFGFMQSFYAAILLALWPAWSELGARKEYRQIAGSLHRHLGLGVALIAVGTALFLLVRESILQLLGANTVALTSGTIAFFAVYYVIRIWTDSYAVVFMSTGNLDIFFKYVPIQIFVGVPLEILLAREFGLAGLVAGLIMSFLITGAWLLPWKFYGLVSTTSRVRV
jgi:O-antigen/teichoic acid export membrane protein